MNGNFLIYGGSGGIGSAIAKRLASKGAKLHLAGRNRERLEPLAEKLGAGFTVGDVCDESFLQRATEEAGNKLDGLVYAVGTITLRGFSRLSAEDYINDFNVNVLGAALAVQRAIPALKQSSQPASVLLFSSVAALKGFPFHASIGTSKAALNGLVLSLAAELAPNIRVNAIAPSLTQTPLSAKLLVNAKTSEAIAKLHPMGRIGEADDIAAMAALLLSAESGWITGQIIQIDGGRSTLSSC